MAELRFDERGVATLDGVWEFFPGDSPLPDLDLRSAASITVPGLWEAQGWLELDGFAWYRRRFSLTAVDRPGWWTLCFGAVMDMAEVWLNNHFLGGHDNPFTPFALDATAALQSGNNVLAVRVFDPAVADPEHIRLAHGKQGWANHVFPSRPSLYMTYGGIWQSVELHRHGPLVVHDVFVNGDPDDLTVEVTVANKCPFEVRGRIGVRAVGCVFEVEQAVSPRATERVVLRLGASPAARWTPEHPVLHEASVDVVVDEQVSDVRRVRFGLRTVRVQGTRLLINDRPYRMKSALVQGFGADELYAEGSRGAIQTEVRAARAMGFNTLRLHIKAFNPVYLDVCDELGMLLHCDIPVAEPIAHDEIGAAGESVVATRSVQAVRGQICRDRNHPSIIMWSLMNELCLDRLEAREWDRYERFARALVAAAKEADPTRPIIENDWVEPDTDRVFAGDVLTAHWYGRLHSDYLGKIEQACARWSAVDRPFFVTEFGDWGLPEMPSLPRPPFWDTRELYAAGLAATRWPGSIARFVTETQRYQGLSDRLQAEVFRRHDHLGGYCVTELTDVPHELNGLLDLHRAPKTLAVAEMARANQTVLPMLRLTSLVVMADEYITAELHVANDGERLDDVVVEARLGDTRSPMGMDELLAFDLSDQDPGAAINRFNESLWATRMDHLGGQATHLLGTVVIAAPSVPGSHDLVVSLRARGDLVAVNRYTLHVLAVPEAPLPVHVIGGPSTTVDALEGVAAHRSDTGTAIVGEGCLDQATGDDVRRRLAAGEVVIVLAQPESAAEHYPVPVDIRAVDTEWGSSVFHFTTDHGALQSLPRRNVLVAEDSTIQAHGVVTRVGPHPFPDTPVVIAYKPMPGAMTGTVVGSHQVGPGRLVFCQFRLCRGAAKGDAAARALLADLLRWAGQSRSTLSVEESRLDGGRRVARYWHTRTVAR